MQYKLGYELLRFARESEIKSAIRTEIRSVIGPLGYVREPIGWSLELGLENKVLSERL